MIISSNFGGWIDSNSISTELKNITIRLVAATVVCCSLSFGASATTGTGGISSVSRIASTFNQSRARSLISESVIHRTPLECLLRIRETLSPPISELALSLNVTRQTVYNWINGEAIADVNAEKLSDLAMAADVISFANIKINSMLLKRKFFHGKTLLQAVKDGESAKLAADYLVDILNKESEDKNRLNERFALRGKTAKTEDFDIPAADSSYL